MTSTSAFAYGRADDDGVLRAAQASCQTNFMARVIFCVDFFDAICVRMLFEGGIVGQRRSDLRRPLGVGENSLPNSASAVFIRGRQASRPCRRCPCLSAPSRRRLARVDERERARARSARANRGQAVAEAVGHGERG